MFMTKIVSFFTMLMLTTMLVYGQARVITGRVLDDAGAPVNAASILVRGTNTGTSADANGNFTINAKKGDVLVISAVGVPSKEVRVTSGSTVEVSLLRQSQNLSEVVVTALGVQRQKRALGYATQQVSGNDLNRGQNSNPIAALQGKVSGVNITTGSNNPGSSTRIVLRGGSSITGSNQPLMVIDGVPISNDNFFPDAAGTNNSLNNQVDYGNRGNDINPEDIESISVLKGPAATALYGQNASNGAVIITTKKGAKSLAGKKYAVTYSTSFGLQDVLKLPDFQNEFGQGNVDAVQDDRRENFSWGLPFNNQPRPWGQIVNGKQQIKPYSALKNNVKDFFDIGNTWNNNISFSGGGDKTTFYLSFNALTNKGVVPSTKYNKYGIRLNATSAFTDNLTGSANIYYSKINSQLANTGQNSGSFLDNVYQTPRDISLIDLKDLSNPYNSMNAKTDSGDYYGYYGAYTINPYYALSNFKNLNYVDRVTSSYSLEYKPWKSVSIIDRFGLDSYSDRRYQKWNKYSSNSFESFSDDFYEEPYGGSPRSYSGKYSQDFYTYNQYNNDLMVTFTQNLGSKVNLRALLGHNLREEKLDNTYAATNVKGIINDNPNLLSLDDSNGPIDAYNTTTNRRIMGVYGNLDLSYNNYLFLNLTGRNDWSSTLPRGNNSFFYPSASLSFVFSELLSNVKALNYGKLRVSWASVGHDAPPYRLVTVSGKTDIIGGYGSTTFPFGGTIPGYSQSDRFLSGNLKPEKTRSLEVGTELAFLNSRLGLDFSWFSNTSVDQIIDAPIAPSTGYTARTINTGKITNKGIELLVKGTPVATRDFRWDMSATFTKVNNKVVSLNEGVDQITLGGFSGMTIVAAVNRPYGTFYSEDILTQNGQPVVDSSTGIPLHTTNPVYKGSYLPDFLASFRNNFSYKGLTLSVLFDMKKGGYFYSRTKDILGFVGTSDETAFNDRKDYIFPNSLYQNYKGEFVQNTTPFHPYTYYTDAGVGIPAGQKIIDATYIKLRELSLSYELPKRLIGNGKFLGSASIGVFANNVFIWTAKENKYVDPEINSEGASNTQGFDYTALPSVRNFGINLRVTF